MSLQQPPGFTTYAPSQHRGEANLSKLPALALPERNVPDPLGEAVTAATNAYLESERSANRLARAILHRNPGLEPSDFEDNLTIALDRDLVTEGDRVEFLKANAARRRASIALTQAQIALRKAKLAMPAQGRSVGAIEPRTPAASAIFPKLTGVGRKTRKHGSSRLRRHRRGRLSRRHPKA